MTNSGQCGEYIKVFGVMPLMLVFGALQYPLLKKYAIAPAE